MTWLTLQQVADRLGVRLQGEDCAVEAVNTDTRKPLTDSLFVALKGENFDAHDALESAEAEVAGGLVVSRPVHHPAPQILVDDTRLALGQLAKSWRSDFKGTVIGLTGSNGKTTVKEMLAAICGHQGATYATEGNLNNDIGMPLSLLKLRQQHDFAVLEMGANHPGEIDYLTRIAQPHVAILNNAGPAHLEGFKSLEGVAQSKGEIFTGLVDGGVAVVNLDDEFADYWLWLNKDRKTVTFGRKAGADVHIIDDQPFVLKLAGQVVTVKFQLLGEHNLMNAASAAAGALAAGVSVENIVTGLESIKAVPGRLCPVESAWGGQLIDDTYNANPQSMKAAIDVLVTQRGRRIFVMGDMAELGRQSEELHAEVGVYAREQGVDVFLSCGSHSERAAQAFGSGAQSFSGHSELVNVLREMLRGDDSVLIKGSRSMRMEQVVAAISMNRSDSEGADYVG